MSTNLRKIAVAACLALAAGTAIAGPSAPVLYPVYGLVTCFPNGEDVICDRVLMTANQYVTYGTIEACRTQRDQENRVIKDYPKTYVACVKLPPLWEPVD